MTISVIVIKRVSNGNPKEGIEKLHEVGVTFLTSLRREVEFSSMG